MNKTTMTIIGFVLFLLGVVSIVLSLGGLQFSFLRFLNVFGTGFSLVLKLGMVFFGVILIYISKLPPEDDYPS